MSMADVLSTPATSHSDVISDQDVMAMRRSYYEDGAINRFEAEKLIQREMTSAGESEAWAEFFIETLTDFLVYQMTPRGYVTEGQAGWLIDKLMRDGKINTQTELELLINVLEKSVDCPESLVEFTLMQIKTAVIEGDGPLLNSAQLRPGVIGKAEVALLSRVLYSAGGANNIGISRKEAEILFDLNDATIESDNDASWNDLFVKAIANHLMAAQGYKAMSREEALRLHDWVNSPTDGTFGLLGKMINQSLSDVRSAYSEQSDEDKAAERLARQIREIEGAEKITQPEAVWVAERIGRDGVVHDNEKALLYFIKDEAPEIHAGLEDLLKYC